MKTAVKKFRKAIAALLGGATAAGVMAVLAAAGVAVDPVTAGAIAAAVASLGALVSPPNEDPGV